MLATREVGPHGFSKKVREWNRTELLLEWRERWAGLASARLAELGLDLAIDHRSYAAQGIELEPQNKIGPAGARREERGEQAERAAEHEEIARRNGERIIVEPERVLAAITRQQSTFTRQDLARFVDRHTADAAQFATAMAVVEASPERVVVGVDGRGRERFSTREMLSVEERLEAASYDLAGRVGHGVSAAVREMALAGAERVLKGEQLAAFEHVTGGADIAAVIGYAGTGKSTMLGAARAAWEASGYRVRGAALSGIAAEGLEGGAGIRSRTLASLEYGWAQGRDRLSAGDVLVVDEAGMIGSRQMERVLSAARDAGAKVVLVGDPEQLQAIEAGAAFRAVAERVGAVEITEIHRQREGWQQTATRELATGQTAAALARYEAAGLVREHATLDEARAGLVAGWNAARQENSAASQIMLAHRRVDVRALNDQARALRQEAGELGADHRLPTGRGERDFAEGDRIYFLKNERSLGVKNGTLGTVERIQGAGPGGEGLGASLVVRLDGANGSGTGRTVSFHLKDYAEIDHGYAATVHKSQGVTVDRAHVLATQGMDRHAAYVGLSRHRDVVSLHWSRDEMGSREGLDTRLGRERLKDTSLDYPQVVRTNRERMDRSDSVDRIRSFQYAERRGLVPESEIVFREQAVEAARQRETPQAADAQLAEASAPRRSKFAGLKLRADPLSRAPVELLREPAALVPHRAPASESELSRAVGQFAEAVEDARRLVRENLPVLPHQQAAMEAGIDAILAADRQRGVAGPGASGSGAASSGRPDLSRPHLTRSDVLDMFDTRAELIAPAAQGRSGRAAVIAALEDARDQRLALEAQARATVRQWVALETEYDRAGKAYEWDAQRKLGSELVAAARELKRDPQLESLMRARGPEFGIAEGSRLDRVVQTDDLDRALRREIKIDNGLRQDRGLGMGM
jgi:Ti-type conjugative transfer relaxase TraA